LCCGEAAVPVRIVRAAAGGPGRSAAAHLRGGERRLGADARHRRQQLLQRPAVEPTVFVLKTQGHVNVNSVQKNHVNWQIIFKPKASHG
jgi:hypothetical protein